MDKKLTKSETKEKALRLLEFRSHSEYELRSKLKAKGAESEDIDEVVEFLTEYGFLDDLKYASAKAKDLAVLKKYGKIRIIAELKSKGIASDIIDEALSGLETDETEMLYPLVEKKLGDNFERKNTEKVIRYFASRGYNISDIKNVIDDLRRDFEEREE